VSKDLEWEVTHRGSAVHKGRGDTPEKALADLVEGMRRTVSAAREEADREAVRAEKYEGLLRGMEDAALVRALDEIAADG
jgi:hypothetical protein